MLPCLSGGCACFHACQVAVHASSFSCPWGSLGLLSWSCFSFPSLSVSLQSIDLSIPSLQVGLFSFSFGYFTHKSTLPPLLHDSVAAQDSHEHRIRSSSAVESHAVNRTISGRSRTSRGQLNSAFPPEFVPAYGS